MIGAETPKREPWTGGFCERHLLPGQPVGSSYCDKRARWKHGSVILCGGCSRALIVGRTVKEATP